MKASIILDLYYRKIYGPYTNVKKLKKDLKIIREISDKFLEISTNVYVVDDTCDFTKFYGIHFTLENITIKN